MILDNYTLDILERLKEVPSDDLLDRVEMEKIEINKISPLNFMDKKESEEHKS